MILHARRDSRPFAGMAFTSIDRMRVFRAAQAGLPRKRANKLMIGSNQTGEAAEASCSFAEIS